MKITSIARNTSYFTLALVVQKIISFSYFTILARNLSPELLGKYYLAIGFTAIFSIFIDLGMANVLMREVPKKEKKPADLLAAVLGIKIPLAIITLISAYLIAFLLGYTGIIRELIYLASLAMLLDSFTVTFYAVIRGHHNLGFESIGSIVFQMIVFSIGLIFLKLGYSLKWILSAQVLASLFNAVYAFSVLKLKLKLPIKIRYDHKLIKMILAITTPFAIYAIFQRLYLYLDTVLLSKLAGDYFVGIYQIPFKIIFALQFLPMAFIASVYPAFSAYWKETKKELSSSNLRSSTPFSTPQLVVTFERAFSYLAIISLPISVGVIVLAPEIMNIFKSEYSGAILPLRLCMTALFFMFVNFPIGAALNACDRQKINTVNMGIVLAASIFMNAILIPQFQAVGAAITVLASNAFMFTLGLMRIPAFIPIRMEKLALMLFKVLASVLMMGAVTMYLKTALHIVLVIPIAGLLYFGLLFLFKGFRKEDVKSVLKSFTKK